MTISLEIMAGEDKPLLKIGSLHPFTGDVTTLNWIGARPPRAIEAGLGYGPGRLARGYRILLLKQPISPEDFNFAGTTMRSGGRVGLPKATAGADQARARIHDQIVSERGVGGYAELQRAALREIAYTGPRRIAKVLPVTDHDDAMSPKMQYPMGGGGLQWRLVQPRNFLIACFVGPNLLAQTPRFSVDLGETHGARLYENRAKLMRYLETA